MMGSTVSLYLLFIFQASRGQGSLILSLQFKRSLKQLCKEVYFSFHFTDTTFSLGEKTYNGNSGLC